MFINYFRQIDGKNHSGYVARSMSSLQIKFHLIYEINEERKKSSATSTLVSATALLTSQKVEHDSNCEKTKSLIP